MPELDAGVALRAILRRFVLACWLSGPSLSGVLDVRELFDEVASLDACVQIRTNYRATSLDRGAFTQVPPAQCSRLFIELHLSIGEHYRGLHPLNAHVPALRAEDSRWVL